MADPLRHRQTKGAATDMVDLTPPRHISTLPIADTQLTPPNHPGAHSSGACRRSARRPHRRSSAKTYRRRHRGCQGAARQSRYRRHPNRTPSRCLSGDALSLHPRRAPRIFRKRRANPGPIERLEMPHSGHSTARLVAINWKAKSELVSGTGLVHNRRRPLSLALGTISSCSSQSEARSSLRNEAYLAMPAYMVPRRSTRSRALSGGSDLSGP
jgi:hypothetical protein